jgi:uncharacterized protein
MPRRDDAPLGAPCWIDLMTSDPDRSRAFYRDLFGWTSESAGEEYGGYVNFSLGDDRIAGCMQAQAEGMPDVWSVYLASRDAAATVRAAAAHGGAVYLEPHVVGPLGTMAMVGDPGGAAVGIWQPGEHRGFQVLMDVGSPAWFQCVTRDYDATVSFYRDVFGWTTSEMPGAPEFRYTTMVVDDEPLAGIHDVTDFLPPEVPPHWEVCFRVQDTDAALVRVGQLGGSVASGPDDSPYGRLATVVDPTGAAFTVVSGD